MQYRTLGRTGLMVSRLGFGGAPIGIPGYLSRDDRDDPAVRCQAIAALREAMEWGVNYFDTAPAYGDGRSESLVGEALAGRRDRVHLATKYAFVQGQGAAAYTRSLQASLRRLGADYVDVLQLHGSYWDDAAVAKLLSSGVLDWADSMRGHGFCHHLGISAENSSGGLERLLRSERFEVLQIGYNAIYQSACDYQRQPPTGIIPLAASLGLGIVTMRPTTCGVLQRLVASEFPEIEPDRLTRLAIRFVLSTPEVDCALVGMRTPDEVRANALLAAESAPAIDLCALHDRFA